MSAEPPEPHTAAGRAAGPALDLLRTDPPAGSRALYTEDLYLVGKSGALGRRKTVPFDDLPSVPLLLERRYQVFRCAVEAVAVERGLTLDVRHEVEPVDAKRALIRRFGVFAVAPLGLFGDEIKRGEMGAWRIVSPSLRLTLYLARRAGLPPPFAWVGSGSVFRSARLRAATSQVLGPPAPPRLSTLGGGLLRAATLAGWSPSDGWAAEVDARLRP
jgi:hypothetical protein